MKKTIVFLRKFLSETYQDKPANIPALDMHGRLTHKINAPEKYQAEAYPKYI